MAGPLTPPGYGAAAPGVAYTDIRAMSHMATETPEALERVACQFESLFFDMWLKSMRDAGAVFSEGNPFSSAAVKVHEEMLDHQWAVHLSEAGGIGIGDVLVRQLSGNAAQAADTAEGVMPRRQARFAAAAPDADMDLRSFGTRKRLFADAAEFVDAVLPAARRALAASALNPLAVVAQAALETGWGQHVIHDGSGKASFNLFGIKTGDWQGPSASVVTLEHEFGRMQPRRADFRVYAGVQEALTDYRALLEGSERYAPVLAQGGDVESFAKALQRSGYATDPEYATKLLGVFKTLSTMSSTALNDG